MYKQKLQELCHKRKWNLPKYSTVKDGFDHNPSFKSSVSVNQLSFHSTSCSNSTKKSQNDAAKIAFLHFTCFSPDQGSQSEYKDQLLKYAQWLNIDAPFYHTRTEGPSHAPQFKSTVVIDGHAFECPDSFIALNEAEDAAAGMLLWSIAANTIEEGIPIVYKSLLQELAQKQCLASPVYNTISTGGTHMPAFCSFVEMEGHKFYGNPGRSKRAAEANAAKNAYSFLTEKLTTEANVEQKVEDSEVALSVMMLAL